MSSAALGVAPVYLAAALLLALVARQLVRDLGSRRRPGWPLALAAASWLVAVSATHVRLAAGHRLYFDEDVYANLALNVGRGYGGAVTTARVGTGKEVELYKWPIAFPALAMPLVVSAGPERGPIIFNELCGALTLATLMGIAARLSSGLPAAAVVAILFGLNPLAAGWYRAGSAEPLALLLGLVSIWAAVRCRAPAAGGGAARRGEWLAIAVLAALLACHARLESALLVLPLLVLLPRRGLRLRRGPALILVAAGAPLALLWAAHLARLGAFYGVGDPMASFGFENFGGNLLGNLRFAGTTAVWPAAALALLGVALAGARAHPRAGSRELFLAWGALGLWQAAICGVLLVYSVGRYSAPGGTRFLLGPLAVLSLIAATGLVTDGRPARPGLKVAAAAGVAVYLLLMPEPGRFWAERGRLNESPAIEHAAVERWARERPEAVVLSPIPYLWENLGVDSALPDRPAAGVDRPLFVHRGLFDSDGRADSVEAVVVDTVATPHGEIALYRIDG